MKDIKIKGACFHNLKGIDIEIPKNKLIVVTGVSGSGKSSLAFDILFEEGRKQYLQSLGMLSSIDDEYKFDSIEGIGPTIAVHQNTVRQSNPHSTVGTRTGLLHMLTLLYSGDGKVQNGKNENTDLSPSFFSYHSADGMCMRCSGKGANYELDLEKLVDDEQMTLKEVFLKSKVTPGYMNILKKRFQDDFDKPFLLLPTDVKNEAIYGRYENGKRSYSLMRVFENRIQKGEDVENIYALQICDECHGYRISEEGRHVLIHGKHIGELCLMPLFDLHLFLKEVLVEETLSQFTQNLIHDILKKLDHLIQIKLGYLSLYREISTLSGGELQRLFLNSHLESQMDSLIYALDEPTAGLHPCEKEEIMTSIQKLKDIGNTVLIVEHDQKTIQRAEHVIDIGPLAGQLGGEVVYQGNISGLFNCHQSMTSQYISGRKQMPVRELNPDIIKEPSLLIKHAKTHNLKDISVQIPLHGMVGIIGKSGSGKSSLISDTLLPLLRTYFHHDRDESSTVHSCNNHLMGIEFIDGFIEISQAPIGRNSHSHPASYIGIWDKVRKSYAQQPSSIEKGFLPGYFSFHSQGACDECGGSGYQKIWLGEQHHIHKVCPKCKGKRFNEKALSVLYKEKTITDILEMSVDEAIVFFDDPSILRPLKILQQIGMGYIKLGQPTPSLSGGESQRIKLAKEIGKKRKGNILYVLDEPTTGLSQYDIAKLIELLDQLVQKGNSIIVVEHDTDVLNVCDYLIELGPHGGSEGGYLVAQGTPEEIKINDSSITGRYL